MTLERINNITVIGAGQMGLGIVQRIATCGYPVNMVDIKEDILRKALQSIDSNLTRQVNKGKIDSTEKTNILSRVSISTHMDSAKESDLVIEAVYENVQIKKKIFGELDRLCRDSTILASNTSSIPINIISSEISRQGSVIGLHFMNPVPLVSFVEVVKSIKTSDDTLSRSLSFLSSIGMDYIVAGDVPGFISSRLLLVMLNEAANLLNQGVGTVEDIDKCCKKCFNHPMGPFELIDLVGIDVIYNTLNIIYKIDGDKKYYPSPVIAEKEKLGFYGKKTGKGFYDYK